MAKFHQKMIKIFFLVVIGTVIVVLVSGMKIAHDSSYFNSRELGMDWDYLKYKYLFYRANKGVSSAEAGSNRTAGSVPVLLYHGVIANSADKDDDTNISLSDFKEQIFALKKAGYKTVTLSEFFQFMKKEKELPERSVLITFDDGRKDSYWSVDPIFKALDFKAAIFVITGQSVGPGTPKNEFYLSLSELQEMKKSGRWEIESHGDADHDWENISASGQKGHFLSNRLWMVSENRIETEDEAQKRITNDLALAKKKIEESLGEKVLGFAYPFNDYGQEEVNFPAAAEFIGANITKLYPLTFAQVEKDDAIGNYPGSHEPYIKRLDVNSSLSSSELLNILDKNNDKNLPYLDTFWGDQGWVSRWGKEMVWGDLQLSDEDEKKSGNLTALLGTRNWQDYSFKADFHIERGNSLSQVVRYRDDDNYLACNFSASGARITERIEGRENIIAEGNLNLAVSAGRDNWAETAVEGNRVRCYLNGVKVAEAVSGGRLASGGIGFYFWDELSESSLVHVRKIEVSPAPNLSI